jgi:hypothetical protein
MIEEQHQEAIAAVDANKDSVRATKIGFISLGCLS